MVHGLIVKKDGSVGAKCHKSETMGGGWSIR